jgi:hypothetical protein
MRTINPIWLNRECDDLGGRVFQACRCYDQQYQLGSKTGPVQADLVGRNCPETGGSLTILWDFQYITLSTSLHPTSSPFLAINSDSTRIGTIVCGPDCARAGVGYSDLAS